MPALEELTIRFDRPEQWPSLPPQDDLHELTPFDFAIQRFFYEKNHRILLSAGTFERTLHLFPDIALVFQFLPAAIWGLSHGEFVELTFPVSQAFLEFAPHGELLKCTLGTFGTESSEYLIELEANKTIREISGLLDNILARAVADGFISRDEADGFLRL